MPFNLFKGDHCIGAVRQGRACGDRQRGARCKIRFRLLGKNLTNKWEFYGMFPSGAGTFGCSHCVTIHGRARKRHSIRIRYNCFRSDATQCVAK